MKALFDANIIISALRFGGKPRQIFEFSNGGKIDGFTSSIAMQEIEAVLRRKFNLSLEEWLLVLEVIKENITIVRVKQLPIVPELRDKADRHILAATHEVRADYIISGDEDLLTLGSYKGIPIINPSAPST